MAIHFAWQILMGGYKTNQTVNDPVPSKPYLRTPTDTIDFTSRVQEFSISANVDFGKQGRVSGQMRLDNSDGAFTPGGGGTYQDWDWMAEPVIIRAKCDLNDPPTTLQHPLFVGFVSDVGYTDDGYDSYVDVQLDDAMSIFARYSVPDDLDTIGVTERLQSVYYLAYGDGASIDDVMPKLGSTGTITDATLPITPDNQFQPLEFFFPAGTVSADFVAAIEVAEYGINYPGAIYFSESGGQGRLEYSFPFIARDWLWPANKNTLLDEIEFVSNPTGTQLPFIRPEVGYTIDNLINNATSSITSGLVYTATGPTINQYGPRAVEFIDLPLKDDSDAERMSEFLVTRFSEVDFIVKSVTVRGSQITGLCDDAALPAARRLVQGPHTTYEVPFVTFPVGPLFYPMRVTYTGAGGVPYDSQVAFFSMSLRATPVDWSITLSDGRYAPQSFGFVFGNTEMGVLGKNRLA
jgi:hypothetical protein